MHRRPPFLSKLFYVEHVTEVTEEYESFDVFSLIGEMGGALGLFLGWSCLNVLVDVVEFAVGKCRATGRKASKP